MNRTRLIKFFHIVSYFFPIQKNTALFESFFGQYSDNPKYVSIELHLRFPFIKQYWVIDNTKCHEQLPEYVKRIKPNSFQYYWLASKAEIVVDNMTGIRTFFSNRNSNLLNRFFIKSSQVNIATWHGTPLKKIGYDMPGFVKKPIYVSSAVYMTAPSKYFEKCFATAYPGILMKRTGYPRNDRLVKDSDEDKKYIKSKLNIPSNKKIVLFAPTFRNDLYESGIHQMEEINLKLLLKEFGEKFGGDWALVFRVHHEVQARFNDRYTSKYPEGFINGNYGDDMAEYLSIADALITDYSGSIYDFAITKRPCFLLTLDRIHYQSVERGFYMSLDELPFPHADSVDELYSFIRSYDANQSEKDINDFLQMIGCADDGNAASKVVNDIELMCELY